MENLNRLKNVLFGNAVFSIVSGSFMLLFNSTMAELFGLDDGMIFYILGPGLILFGLDVAFVAKKKLENKKQVFLISLMDFGWVLGSAAILFTAAFNLSQIGYELIALVGIIVLLFGVLQLKFNR